MTDLMHILSQFPRASLLGAPTPLEPLPRISDTLGIDLSVKRDDLTGLGLGGNKIRQLEYYFGAAQAQKADTILITGAVQSNYVRCAAAAAARLNMRAILQLEDRVLGKSDLYRENGNVVLDHILGAELMHYSEGEDESGADTALRERAEQERAHGFHPYVIPLGLNNPPTGALGYMRAAREILDQRQDFDAIVVASGSGLTHMGLLAGLRLCGSDIPVYGSCVRRDATTQNARLTEVARRLQDMLGCADFLTETDIHLWDGALPPGYGQPGPRAQHAMGMMARQEGLFLDPVYTAKSFAAVPGLLEEGVLKRGMRVLFVHTGGTPALFAYAPELTAIFTEDQA